VKIGLFLPNATFDLPGTSEVGGIETYALELGEQLQKRGHDVLLFGGQPKPGRTHRPIPFPYQLFPYIETTRIPKFGTRFRKLIQRLHFASKSMRAFKEAQLDDVFIFKPYDFINAFRWKLGRKDLKVIMNYQGTDFFPTDRFWRKSVDREYAVSAENARLVGARYGKTVAVIPNAVDTDLFCPGTEKAPTHTDMHILTAGRLVGWKGLRMFAEAFAQTDGIRWHVAGDGPELLWLKKHAGENSYGSRVSWHGVLDAEKLAQLMQWCHAFAQPSIDFDACPTAVLQAMSCGLPVAMSDKVGLRETFVADQDFVLFPSTVEAWQAGLKWLKSFPPETREAFGANARAAILRSFSWDVICGQIEALL
jgi:glycosyltransferase involved in cell wall biosynthesis